MVGSSAGMLHPHHTVLDNGPAHVPPKSAASHVHPRLIHGSLGTH